MPVAQLSEDDFENEEIDVISVLVKSGLAPSRAEAKRNVQQGGVEIDGEKVGDIGLKLQKEKFKEGVVVKRGKKNFKRVVL